MTQKYLDSIENCMRWINTNMLSFDNGYEGIYERIRIDKHMRVNWTRPDCNTEYLRVLHYYQKITNSQEHKPLFGNIKQFVKRVQNNDTYSVWYGSYPFYLVDGQPSIEKDSETIYQNDNGKILIANCQLYSETGDESYLEIAKKLAAYWLSCQTQEGYFYRLDGKMTAMCAKGPCFVTWLASGFFLLYDITKDEDYLTAAEKGMDYLLSLVDDRGRIKTTYEVIKMEDWRPVSSENVMLLYALAKAYRTTMNEKYLSAIKATSDFVFTLIHESGAIMNCNESCLEASLQNNPDLCDLVYTQGHGLFTLVELYQLTQEERYLTAAKNLADFLISIQCKGESPLWDGGFRGSYNVVTKEYDGRANQNNRIDEGGMYSVYTGWCSTTIMYGLELLLLLE